MLGTSTDPPIASIFEACLRTCISSEEKHTDLDLEEYQIFGTSPLSTPPTTPSVSPLTSPPTSPSRSRPPSPAPDLDYAPASLASTNAVQENSRKRRNKAKGKDVRKRKRRSSRDAHRSDPYKVKEAVSEKYLDRAAAMETEYDTYKLPTASTGYVGKMADEGPTCKLKDLKSKGIQRIRWSAERPLLILDSEERIVAAFVCAPDGSDWGVVHQGATEAILETQKRCTFPDKTPKHRRGNFFVLNKGISYGGGQKRPGHIHNEQANASALADLAANKHISRIAGHASGSFATWAPKLYTYTENSFESVLDSDNTLHRNFENSVWASFAVNFGPRTVCRRHRDTSNLPFGWCGITALGDFDATRGGHLILWELKIAVEFPSGATALIPSAAVTHSNAPIARSETRLSFTQFTAGGLFRWADQGHQPTSHYMDKLTAQEKAAELQRQEERCKLALSLFSTLDDLKEDQAARNRLISTR